MIFLGARRVGLLLRGARVRAALSVALLSAIALAGSPAASATNRVPGQLAGQWAIPWQGGTEYVKLADSHFTFFFNSPAKRVTPKGQMSISGDTITFFSSTECTGTGTYQWSRSGGGVTFVQVPGSSDPCPREPVLTSGTWMRR